MKIERIIEHIENFAPLALQEAWDHSGIQVKLGSPEVHRILVALEINDHVIAEGISEKADLIVTHHPLIFRPIGSIDCEQAVGKYLTTLIQNNISVYSSHTSFDKCEGGNNDYLGKILEVEHVSFIEEDETKICRKGVLKTPMSCRNFILHAEKVLQIPKDFFSFSGNLDQEISMIGWCTGAGAEFLELAKNSGCDLFLTGDVKYHDAQHSKELGLNLLDCGHFGTEYIFVENMTSVLDKLPEITTIPSKVNLNPFEHL